MTSPLRHRRPMSAALALTTSVLCLAIVASPHLGAQTPTSPSATERRFAVASVKPNPTTNEDIVRAITEGRAAGMTPAGMRTASRRRFTAIRVPLRGLIIRAYGLKDYQLDGGPAWLTSSYFDIDARADEDATDEELNVMLRALLADRFALKTRMETRQLPVHVVTLARSDGRLGPSIKPTSAACVAEIEERRRTNTPVPSIGPPPAQAEAMRELLRTPRCGATTVSTSMVSGTTIAAGGMAISTLIERLAAELSAPVTERTGLTGLYDYVLEFESNRVRMTPPPGLSGSVTLESRFPPLRDALQKQLGLKLETEAGPVSVLAIESAEVPEPN